MDAHVRNNHAVARIEEMMTPRAWLFCGREKTSMMHLTCVPKPCTVLDSQNKDTPWLYLHPNKTGIDLWGSGDDRHENTHAPADENIKGNTQRVVAPAKSL